MNYIPLSILLVIVSVLIWLFLARKARQKSAGHSVPQQRSVLLLKFPKEEKTEKNFKDEIGLSEKFFNLLSNFENSVIFEVAVHHVGEEIHFYLIGDKKTLNFVGRRIRLLWPGVQLNLVEDYDIFNPQGFNEGAYLKLAHEFSLPIRTYEESDADTFAPILAVLARLEEIGEGSALQIIFKPAPKSIRRKIANKKKIASPLFEVNLRLVVSAGSQFRAKEIFENLINIFSRFSTLSENELKVVKPKNIKRFHFDFSFREFDEEQAMILNSGELASIFHFPTSFMITPRIKWLKSKEAKSPAGISNRGIILGENVFQGRVQPVYLDYPDRAYHLEVIGQAGTGKSTSVINMAIQDIKQGKGVAIIDPEGDIIQGVVGNIPKERKADVIYFDPTNILYPFGLNLLEFNPDNPEEKNFVIEETYGIFQKLFAKEAMGPMFEKYLKNSLRLLLNGIQAEPATLLDIPRIFTDYAFRQKKIQQAADAGLTEFWKNEAALHEITPFITSKFNNLIANDYLRPIIGQTNSAFNFRKAMDAGKIILINLAKSRLGDINADLLGMIFVEKISLAAFSRIDQIEERRRPFYLYLDEFHNYITDSLAVSLASVFKYGLHLNVIHRSTDELSPALLNLVNNFGSIIVFRVGLDDARVLADKFEPDFSVNDLINLDNFNAYSRILIKGNLSKPFNVRVLLPPAADSVLTQEIKKLSQIVYNQNRQKVEMEIYEKRSSSR
ncbi:MAG: hypothetical protein Q8N22_03110 [bacterium]|nr:hypothetical protein [bacterium]